MMLIGVLGVNHKSADLPLRESLARVCARRFSPGRSAHSNHFFVLLSTCNRTEIYFSSNDLAATHSYLLRVLRYDIEQEFEHRLYSYFGYDCFSHLAKVTAGMDSAILAETEIQGQVKSAYEAAKEYSDLPRELHFLFQKNLKIGKDVRTVLSLKKCNASFEEAIVQSLYNTIEDALSSEILFVGASEINIKIGKMLQKKGFNHLTFCNRTKQRLEELDQKLEVKTISWEEKRLWPNFGAVIVGTKAPEYLLQVKEMLPIKKQLLIDLSVPRNIDPQLDAYDHITLLNVDQINKTSLQSSSLNHLNINKIDKHISELVENQIAFFAQKEEARKERLNQTRLVIHGA